MLALSPTLQALAQAGPVELLPQGAGPEVGPGWVGAPAGAGTHIHICLQVSSNEGGRAHGIVGCWRTQGWTGRNTLWDAGGPGVGGPQCIVGCWRTQGWEDPNALWDAGEPRVGGLQCIVGCWRTWGGRTEWDGGRTPMHCGMVEDQGWEDRNALWGGGGPRGGRAAMHCGMLEDPGVGGPQCVVGCWRTQGWEDCNALWDGGGPGVGGLQCIVGCWRAQGGRTALHCGVVEDLGWEDHNALWDGGGLQCIMGCWRSQMGVWCHYGILEGRRALWDVGGPRWGPHIIMGF